jgi:hypothetical protein
MRGSFEVRKLKWRISGREAHSRETAMLQSEFPRRHGQKMAVQAAR